MGPGQRERRQGRVVFTWEERWGEVGENEGSVEVKPQPNSRGPTCLAGRHVVSHSYTVTTPPVGPSSTSTQPCVSSCPFITRHPLNHNHLNSLRPPSSPLLHPHLHVRLSHSLIPLLSTARALYSS